MLSKRQWIAFLCVFVGYALFGASVFYFIESVEEAQRASAEEKQKQEINDLIRAKYPPQLQEELFYKIGNYCKKPVGDTPHDSSTAKLEWTFYHSVFFVLTILSTIGYGNLSPTTTFTRVFMIIYGVVGIPINGIVIITLGSYFGTTFTNIYKRWRNKENTRPYHTLGMVGKIVLYSCPGFAFLIIVPSIVIVLYEGWSFDKAVEFAFGTLTTIGVGQVVPGVFRSDNDVVHVLYNSFLLIWIIIGLGYVAMVFGFITKGLQSEKMFNLEQKLTNNIKKTNKKIRKELRYILDDLISTQSSISPVYRERRVNVLAKHSRTQSCPDLRQFVERNGKRRATSVLYPLITIEDEMSETHIQRIERIKTLESNINIQHSELLEKVVNALSDFKGSVETADSIASSGTGVNDCEAFHKTKDQARQEDAMGKCGETHNRRVTVGHEPESLFSKLRRRIRSSFVSEKLDVDSEGQLDDQTLVAHASKPPDNSLSDFLRALSIINFNEISKPNGDGCKANSRRRLPIVPLLRRTSLISTVSSRLTDRRRSSEDGKAHFIRNFPRYSAFARPVIPNGGVNTSFSNTDQRNFPEIPTISKSCTKGDLNTFTHV
uniref:Potassium channel domain-containing protein n=1 Tax=Photinus pyralis TaxID=7054 RepID=A0A1Y1L911_PHOPY